MSQKNYEKRGDKFLNKLIAEKYMSGEIYLTMLLATMKAHKRILDVAKEIEVDMPESFIYLNKIFERELVNIDSIVNSIARH